MRCSEPLQERPHCPALQAEVTLFLVLPQPMAREKEAQSLRTCHPPWDSSNGRSVLWTPFGAPLGPLAWVGGFEHSGHADAFDWWQHKTSKSQYVKLWARIHLSTPLSSSHKHPLPIIPLGTLRLCHYDATGQAILWNWLPFESSNQSTYSINQFDFFYCWTKWFRIYQCSVVI